MTPPEIRTFLAHANPKKYWVKITCAKSPQFLWPLDKTFFRLNLPRLRRIQVVIQSLRLTQELRAEDDILAVELLTNRCGVAHRDGGLDDHDGIRIVLHDQLDHSFDCTRVEVLCVAVVVSGLNAVRKSCSTVAYKAHLLPYVATYALFRA